MSVDQIDQLWHDAKNLVEQLRTADISTHEELTYLLYEKLKLLFTLAKTLSSKELAKYRENFMLLHEFMQHYNAELNNYQLTVREKLLSVEQYMQSQKAYINSKYLIKD